MLKVKQVAERLNKGLSSVYVLFETGQLAYHKIGGSFRVAEEDLKAYLESCRVEQKRGEGKAQSLPARANPSPRVKKFVRL